jgi:uncharacterized membrane protein YhaH (DUF805 family)
MRFAQAVSLAFRKTFQFHGRATRSEYWWFALAVMLGTVVLFAIWAVIMNSDVFAPLVPFTFLLPIIMTIPAISLSVRRLHDLNFSGWWLLVYSIVPKIAATASQQAARAGVPVVGQQVVPVISILTMIIVYGGFLYYFSQRGTIGSNDYGPDPLEEPLNTV